MKEKLSLEEIKRRFEKVKLIVSDIDGTIINNQGEVGAETKAILKDLKSKNINLTLATQRIHSSVVPIAKDLNISAPLITLNGSYIADINGNVINKFLIKPKKVELALKLAEKYFCKIALCTNDMIVYTEDNSVLKDFMGRIGTNYELINSYKNYMNNTIEIIMMGNDKHTIKKIQNKLSFPFKLHLSAKYFRSQSHRGVYNLEARRSKISKKTGVEQVTKILKLKRDEVAVFGDWYNDRELFKFGGINIALQNAVGELKADADYVTEFSNDEDGLGRFLKLIYT
ncbi:MAG TPA: Cof-type HAD-IIB family hydrolase [Ignavibacteria bacterium]|nr:Cof-type HAD-IIB family hydrolase [Ignavibacteria bacterium]